VELRARVPDLRELHVSELGAAVGAHVGPGAVGVVVAPAADPAEEDPAEEDPAEEDPAEEDPAEEAAGD
jgi:hypothetical protein